MTRIERYIEVMIYEQRIADSSQMSQVHCSPHIQKMYLARHEEGEFSPPLGQAWSVFWSGVCKLVCINLILSKLILNKSGLISM